MTVPRRLEKRRDHLDAHVVPVERALLARADDIERTWSEVPLEGNADAAGRLAVASEFRKLADELHFWG